MGTSLNRRHFLSALAVSPWAAAASGRFLQVQKPEATMKSKRASEALVRLRGPMVSVTIPFADDGAIDFSGLRRWVAFLCERRVPVLFMTLGDSELEFLTEAEIEAVTRTIVREAAGRTLVCGGTGPWATRQMIEFVKRMGDSGVDAMNLHFTPRIAAAEEYERAFAEVAASTEMPLLAYEVSGNFTLPLVKAIARLPTVIGMKCHDALYGYYDYARATRNDGFALLGPGQMRQHLFGHQVGSPAWLCLVSSLAPEIGLRFHDAIGRDDIKAARQLVFDYEEPLLELTRGYGWPHAYKSIQYIAGHYRTNAMRPPRRANTATQVELLRELLRERFGIRNHQVR